MLIAVPLDLESSNILMCRAFNAHVNLQMINVLLFVLSFVAKPQKEVYTKLRLSYASLHPHRLHIPKSQLGSHFIQC